MIRRAIGSSSLASDGPSFLRSVCNASEFGGPMSAASQIRSEEFLKISDQFQLGVLTTEASHPITAELSQTAKRDVSVALGLLFDVDSDVVRKYREFVDSGCAGSIQETLVRSLKQGGKVFFTG